MTASARSHHSKGEAKPEEEFIDGRVRREGIFKVRHHAVPHEEELHKEEDEGDGREGEKARGVKEQHDLRIEERRREMTRS